MAKESAVTDLPPLPERRDGRQAESAATLPATELRARGREQEPDVAAPVRGREQEPDATAPARGRHRNRRGEGLRLREEILTAAVRIIERTGSDQALTLRAVAREVGIAAPSIYAHFPDRDAIVDAVIIESLTQLRAAVLGASSEFDDPVDALLAGCAAYVAFGTREAARYRLLFGSPRVKAEPADCPPGEGMLAFRTLVDSLEDCVRAGRSASDDPFGDAIALWTALHGQVTLRAGQPDFPWPPTDTVAQLVRRLGRIIPEV
ncbi:TetR/AcrR family transcriptional regulator [Kitasatospora sp. NBC_00315]|uniref:TetR/AcrR family transcriptional regulator n=1 Tax=Kitasatospora sp. NBC_00315 TaxID=2975963 RepID=UPI003245B855